MILSYISSKITSSPDTSGWVQTHEFKPQDKVVLDTRGTLFAVISTAYQDSKETLVASNLVIGREVLMRFHEEYYGDLEKSPYLALKESVEKVINEQIKSGVIVQIAAISLVGGLVYSSAGGGGRVSIYRNKMLATILESANNVISASGRPEEKDILVISTKPFFDIITQGNLRAALDKEKISDSAEFLAPIIHSGNGRVGVGVIFINFVKPIETVTSESVKNDNTPSDSENYKQENNALLEGVAREQHEVFKPHGKGIFSLLLRRPVEADRKDVSSHRPQRFWRRETEAKPELGKENKRDILTIFGKRKVFLRRDTGIDSSKLTKKNLFLGLVILTMLIIAAIAGIKVRNKRVIENNFEAKLTESKHYIEEAVNLYNLNPGDARDLFKKGEAVADGLTPNGAKSNELENLKQLISDNKGNVLGEFNTNLEQLVDLSLLSDGFRGTKISLSGNDIYVFDRDQKKIAKTNIEAKGSQIIAGPSVLENAFDQSSGTNSLFVIKNDGVYEISDKTKKIISDDWNNKIMLNTFGGNIYVLDKNTALIWRYAPTESGYSNKNNWLKGDSDPELLDCVSWSIDGSIWTLIKGQKIVKYSLGVKEGFDVKNMEVDFNEADAIYTGEDRKYLYVLDPQNKRMVVLTKEGEFKAEYLSDDFGNAIDLVVSETNKKAIILTPGKLFTFQIKHL